MGFVFSQAVAPERIWKWGQRSGAKVEGHRSGAKIFWSCPSNFWL